jgi:hypothetical protein
MFVEEVIKVDTHSLYTHTHNTHNSCHNTVLCPTHYMSCSNSPPHLATTSTTAWRPMTQLAPLASHHNQGTAGSLGELLKFRGVVSKFKR